MEKGPILILVLGLAILAAGIVRFLHLGHFTLMQAVYCLISIPAALVLLLMADYTLHHARIVFVMVLGILILLAIGSPAFCVGLGAGLAGMVLTQWRR